MNLLAKIRVFGALMMALIIFNSCEESGSFGLGADDISQVQFSSDSISIGTSIVWIDSINTADLGRVVIGEHQNSGFGAMSATGYVGLDLNETAQPILISGDRFDSAKLNVSINYLFDTTSLERTFNPRAYQIGEPFPNNSAYNTQTEFDQSSTLIATGDFQIDSFDSTYALDVDTDWANLVFEGIRNNLSSFQSQAGFEQFFPGFVFRHEGSSNNLFGISAGEDFELVLYYSQPANDGTGTFRNREITLNNSGRTSFYNLTVDRSLTDFAFVNAKHVAFDAGNKAVVQSGAGLVTLLDLSDFQRFTDENSDNSIIINLAEIRIGPIDELPNGIAPPSSLSLLLTDERNTVIEDGASFRSIQRDGASILSSRAPLELLFDSQSRSYVASVTTFTQAYFNNVFRRDKVFIYPNGINQSANGFTIDPSNIQIKIFYSQLR